MSFEPEDLYYWRMFYGTDSISQVENNAIDPIYKIDPENPGFQIDRIVLIPRDPEWPELEIEIPSGAKPVCHRLKTCITANGKEKIIGLHYRIGYQTPGKRTMKVIDAFTGAIKMAEDNKGK